MTFELKLPNLNPPLSSGEVQALLNKVADCHKLLHEIQFHRAVELNELSSLVYTSMHNQLNHVRSEVTAKFLRQSLQAKEDKSGPLDKSL